MGKTNVAKIIIENINNSIIKNKAIEINDDELDGDNTALTTKNCIFELENFALDKLSNGAVSDDDFKAIFGYSAKEPENKLEEKKPKENKLEEKKDSTKVGNDSTVAKRVEAAMMTKAQRPTETDAYNAGNELYKILDGNTEDYEYTRVNEIIDNEHLDKDNVMKILEGFYAGNSHEGLIEMLDDEWDGGAILMDNKKNVIASFILCAQDHGLGNDADVKKLQMILGQYTGSESLANETTFNNNGWTKFNWARGGSTAAGAAAGAAVGAVAGGGVFSWASAGIGALIGGAVGACDRVTDNEVIDDLMKKIYDKIKAKK